MKNDNEKELSENINDVTRFFRGILHSHQLSKYNAINMLDTL